MNPKVLVYTSQANGPSFGYSDQESWELAQRVIAYAQIDFPGIKIYLVGAAPSRDQTPEDVEQKRAYNRIVKEFAENTPNCYYLDTLEYAPLDRKDIYIEDGVHFNQAGYDIYAEFFKEALKDELAAF